MQHLVARPVLRLQIGGDEAVGDVVECYQLGVEEQFLGVGFVGEETGGGLRGGHGVGVFFIVGRGGTGGSFLWDGWDFVGLGGTGWDGRDWVGRAAIPPRPTLSQPVPLRPSKKKLLLRHVSQRLLQQLPEGVDGGDEGALGGGVWRLHRGAEADDV